MAIGDGFVRRDRYLTATQQSRGPAALDRPVGSMVRRRKRQQAAPGELAGLLVGRIGAFEAVAGAGLGV